MDPIITPTVGYAISGIIVGATNMIIESAMDAALDVTVDYVSEQLEKVFPEISNPESFWGKFATNVKMNASAQMQARIMSQAMQVQNTATDYIEGLRKQRIDQHNTDCNELDQSNPTFNESASSLNMFEYVTLKPFRDGSMFNKKYRNGKKAKLKDDLSRDLERYDKELNTFRETRNTGYGESKAFSNSFADYNQSANSHMTSNVRNATTIDKLLVGMGYYKDKEGVYKLGSAS